VDQEPMSILPNLNPTGAILDNRDSWVNRGSRVNGVNRVDRDAKIC